MRSELPVVLVAKLLHSFFESIIVANVVKYFVISVHLGEYRCPRLVKLLYQVKKNIYIVISSGR